MSATAGREAPLLADQVELLGLRDWRVVGAACEALARAGEDGVRAALEGLSHPNPRVRRGAADFLDHYADDRCVAKLSELALGDPVAYVRRVAVHALLCQRCKPAPLSGDVIPLLVRVARDDPNRRVRMEAVWGLGTQPRDARAVAALTAVLHDGPAPKLFGAAHDALKRQSPEYRRAAAERARARAVSGATAT